jgi:hypothetical protein
MRTLGSSVKAAIPKRPPSAKAGGDVDHISFASTHPCAASVSKPTMTIRV